MSKYLDIFNMVLRREYALIGRAKTKDIFAKVNIKIGSLSRIEDSDDLTKDKLSELLELLNKTYGYIAILVVKLPVRRLAIKAKLELPTILL